MELKKQKILAYSVSAFFLFITVFVGAAFLRIEYLEYVARFETKYQEDIAYDINDGTSIGIPNSKLSTLQNNQVLGIDSEDQDEPIGKEIIAINGNEDSTVNIPNSGIITPENNKIILNIPEEERQKVETYIAELTLDGVSYIEVYRGTSNEIEFDLEKLPESGNYFLRITKEFEDGSTEVLEYEEAIQIQKEEEGELQDDIEESAQQEIDLSIININPANGIEILERKPVIRGEFAGSADPSNYRLIVTVNDTNVSLDIDITENGFNYTPPEDLPIGNNTVKVAFLNNGETFYEIEWSFTILGEEEGFLASILNNRNAILTVIFVSLGLIIIVSILLFLFSKPD